MTIGVYEAQDAEIREVFRRAQAPKPNRSSVFVWSSVYKKSIIGEHGIRFIRGITHGEDSLFLNDFCNFCKEHDSLSYTVYYYRHNDHSVTNTAVRRNLLNCINSEFKLIELMKIRYGLSEYRNILTLEYWSHITGSLLNEISKLEKNEAVRFGKRLKTEKVCPKFNLFTYIGTGCFGTALRIKNKSIWQRFFGFLAGSSFGHWLLKTRIKFNDSLLGYILKHPKRFVRHPLLFISVKSKLKMQENTKRKCRFFGKRKTP